MFISSSMVNGVYIKGDYYSFNVVYMLNRVYNWYKFNIKFICLNMFV